MFCMSAFIYVLLISADYLDYKISKWSLLLYLFYPHDTKGGDPSSELKNKPVKLQWGWVGGCLWQGKTRVTNVTLTSWTLPLLHYRHPDSHGAHFITWPSLHSFRQCPSSAQPVSISCPESTSRTTLADPLLNWSYFFRLSLSIFSPLDQSYGT